MAIGTGADFKVYPDQFYSGLVETLQQETDLWNASSGGVMQFTTQLMRGDYQKQSFFKNTAGIVQDRDVTSIASVPDLKLTQDEVISIKVNKRIGPVADTLDAWKKIAVDPNEFSVIFGQQAGKTVAINYVDSALASLRASLKSIGSAVQYDASADTLKTANHTALISGMSLLGDKASRIGAFVMHSKTYFELVKQSVADNIVNVADVTIYHGTAATFGKPVIVTDSASLYDVTAGSPLLTKYDVLALVPGAVEVIESEDRNVASFEITGLANLAMRIQSEYAYNLKVKGMSYTGAVQPTDASLAVTGNWTFKMGDIKNGPGSRITFQN
jgi:major capsid protein 13